VILRAILSTCNEETGEVDQLNGEMVNHRLHAMFVKTASCSVGQKKITFKQRICFKCMVTLVQSHFFNTRMPSYTGETEDEYYCLVRQVAACIQTAVYGQSVVDGACSPFYMDSDGEIVPITIYGCKGFVC